MNTQLHRLVYCSRNRIRGSKTEIAAELHKILQSARRNNTAVSVTGALLYNSGNFAQVLEGPLAAVERIFEKIQRDIRHTEVTIIQSETAAERQFPEWSMAFAGNASENPAPMAAAAFEAAFGHAVGAGEQILGILRELVVQEDDWVLIDAA